MDTEHKRLYDAAVALVQQRYPTGWGGAAAIRLANGDIVTSISPDVLNEALSVCMELGAFLEAHKQNQAVTHSLCLYRDDETAPFKILTPCGICQEHLRFGLTTCKLPSPIPITPCAFTPWPRSSPTIGQA